MRSDNRRTPASQPETVSTGNGNSMRSWSTSGRAVGTTGSSSMPWASFQARYPATPRKSARTCAGIAATLPIVTMPKPRNRAVASGASGSHDTGQDASHRAMFPGAVNPFPTSALAAAQYAGNFPEASPSRGCRLASTADRIADSSPDAPPYMDAIPVRSR